MVVEVPVDYPRAREKTVTPIQTVVLSYFKIKQEKLCGTDRHPWAVRARHIAQYLERERGIPFGVIGTWYRRDHSTVLLAHRHVTERLAKNDENYSVPVAQIRRLLAEYEASEAARRESKANMSCVACGISVAELLEQIRNIHRRLDSLGAKP